MLTASIMHTACRRHLVTPNVDVRNTLALLQMHQYAEPTTNPTLTCAFSRWNPAIYKSGFVRKTKVYAVSICSSCFAKKPRGRGWRWEADLRFPPPTRSRFVTRVQVLRVFFFFKRPTIEENYEKERTLNCV